VSGLRVLADKSFPHPQIPFGRNMAAFVVGVPVAVGSTFFLGKSFGEILLHIETESEMKKKGVCMILL
jgi:hypothetical protein